MRADDGNGVPEDKRVRLPTAGEAAAALPGLARIAAATWFNAAQWSLQTSARTGRRLLSVTGDPAQVAERSDGVDRPPADDPTASLRERGADLLARSRDVWHEEEMHPAYGRILGDLAPDEGRVLMLLLRSGPQPSVDIRSGGPVGRVSSHLIAPGLTMIGALAGCRYLDRVPAYLNNLHRLGLVWFSREQLTDPMEYQVLEAQPDVLEALHSQRFTKVVRRSIHITPFGEDFCHAVLFKADDDADYPSHQVPDEAGEA